MYVIRNYKANYNDRFIREPFLLANWTRSPAIAEGPRDAGVPVEIW